MPTSTFQHPPPNPKPAGRSEQHLGPALVLHQTDPPIFAHLRKGLRSKHRWHRPSEEEGRDTARKGWQVRPLGFFGCAEICWLHFVWNLLIQSWECWGLHKSSSMSSFPRKRAGQLRASGHFTHHRITPRLPELPEAPRLPHDGH